MRNRIQTHFLIGPADERMVAEIQRRLGLESSADAWRLALHLLHDSLDSLRLPPEVLSERSRILATAKKPNKKKKKKEP